MALSSFYRSRNIFTLDLKKRLCESLVLSHTNYAVILYGPYLDAVTSNRVQKIQHCCVRFILSLSIREHITPHLHELNSLNMFKRRKLHLACFPHKVLKLGIPLYLREKLSFRADCHNRNTRGIHFMELLKYRKTSFVRCFTYCVVKLYNSSPISSQIS
ncbi:hypothetical protein HHI36_008370 [Cryptolaemus montrouzieri]|uniref:Maturase K n=1 Tax=Cryptolaemus montrouzieri TaxID=559131 RepID=A0ABD2MSK8_9CUCU